MFRRVQNIYKRYYKKHYKYGLKENIFTFLMGSTIIFSVNTATPNFQMERNLAYLICAVMLSFLGIWLSYHLNIYAKNKKINILSQDAERRLRIFNRYIWVMYPLTVFGFFIFKGERAFAPIGLAMMWLLAMKYYLFDNIICFGKAKYLSGFDEVDLSEKIKIEKIPQTSFGFIGMVGFQVVKENKIIGWDKFYACDFELLWEIYGKTDRIAKEKNPI